MLDEGCGCPTGVDMVDRMISFYNSKKPHCIVHSANTTGGQVMAQTLHDAGFSVSWSPVFTWENMITSTIFKLWRM
jgi:hypothetical protein